jgi:hypothetical protein
MAESAMSLLVIVLKFLPDKNAVIMFEPNSLLLPQGMKHSQLEIQVHHLG